MKLLHTNKNELFFGKIRIATSTYVDNLYKGILKCRKRQKAIIRFVPNKNGKLLLTFDWGMLLCQKKTGGRRPMIQGRIQDEEALVKKMFTAKQFEKLTKEGLRVNVKCQSIE